MMRFVKTTFLSDNHFFEIKYYIFQDWHAFGFDKRLKKVF